MIKVFVVVRKHAELAHQLLLQIEVVLRKWFLEVVAIGAQVIVVVVGRPTDVVASLGAVFLEVRVDLVRVGLGLSCASRA